MSSLPARGTVPDGTRFGYRIALTPFLLQPFARAVEHQWQLHGHSVSCPYREFDTSYQWVYRGTPLARVVIPISKPTKRSFWRGSSKPATATAYIKSPVSGMLLTTIVMSFANRPTMLLVNDEPPAEPGEYVFSEVCDLIWKYRDLLFFEPEIYQGQYDDEKIRTLIAEQNARACEYSDSYADFRDNFAEAKQRHPNLTPLLAHLG